jgi:hypothetical protein
MPASHGQQKQREKQKKKRDAAKRKGVHRPGLLGLSPAAVLRQAALLPMGRCFISASLTEDDPRMPALVSVIVTRAAPGGVVVPGIALVDRTCLGVKNGFVGRPMPDVELDPFLHELGKAHGSALTPCTPLVAQSVVYHALDYARSLGFEPHRDFPEPLFGPRPEALLDTPLARPERPVYVPGPDDPMARILEHLVRKLGPEGFDFTGPAGPLSELGEIDEDDEDGWDDEDDEGEDGDAPV